VVQREAYIDALRGYAILAVIMVHSSQLVSGLEWPIRQFAQKGQRGVQLFFVVSALTLMSSWHRRNDGAGPFLIRRAFRIAPMFWLAIIFFVLLDGFGPRYFAPEGIGWLHVAATAAFVHGWYPTTINSVVPGGWSIAVEMMFYLGFPFIVWWLREWRSTTLALAVAMLVAPELSRTVPGLLWPRMSDGVVGNFGALWLPKQLPVFLIGVLTFHLSNRLSGKCSMRGLEIGAAVCVALILLAPFLPGIGGLYPCAALFGALAFTLGQGAGKWLVVAPVRALGIVSYSAYLVHFAILGVLVRLRDTGIDPFGIGDAAHGWSYFLFCYIALVAATAACSTLTYRYVEKPGIAVGRWLANRMRPRNFPCRASSQLD
jgi:peptidoglycan/LPS O-acetylase OafA/YrhL